MSSNMAVARNLCIAFSLMIKHWNGAY